MPLAAPILQTTLAGRRARSSGQSPRHLRLRRSPADRRDRSHLRVRLRARLRHSRQGQGPHAALGVLVRADARDRRRITCSRPTSRDYPGGRARRRRACCAGRSMLVRADRAAADRMRRARLPVRLRLEGLPGDRRGLRHHAAAGPARVGSAAGADLHAGDQGRRAATTSTSAKRTRRRSSARRARARARAHAAALRRGRRRTPSRAASSSPTPSSSSACCPTTAVRQPIG